MEPNFKQRIDDLWIKINGLDGRTRLDMKKMFQSCEKLYDELSNETIVCRIKKVTTSKYKHLTEELEQRLSETEQYLVIASLIS